VSVDQPNPIADHPGSRLRAAAFALLVIGVVTFGVMLAVDAQRAWAGLLQGMLIPTFIAIGALFFICVHSVCGAQWTLPLRRLMEGMTSGLPITALAFIAIAVAGGGYLYEWVHANGDAHHSLFHANRGDGLDKAHWMSQSRWIATGSIIIALWLGLRWLLLRLSLRQDGGADIAAVHERLSIATLMLVAISFTLFTWDMLLSLHVHFVSTMWGVYCFTSAVQTFLAVLVLFALWLRSGPLKGMVQAHTLHDLGTWILAWSCFCAYIGFAQYLVIYYANLDEETYFFLIRSQHGYGAAYVAETLIRCVLPFAVLMSQSMRARPAALAAVAVALLLGNWMDWSWIVMPAFAQNSYRGFYDLPTVLIGAGCAGAFILLTLNFWRRHGYVIKGDARLQPTINAEHLN
jgi:hypothetical protein